MAGASNILVTGGTGKTGRTVVTSLQRRGVPYKIAARKPPETASAVQFDWMDESTFDKALAGVDGIYLVAPAGVPDPLPVMSTFISKALDQGVRRLVLLSSSAIPIDGPVQGGVHRFLADHAPEWAVVQPCWFFENFTEMHHADTIKRENRVYSATGDAAIAFIGATDIAESSVECLLADQPLNDGVVLTGPVSHSYDEMAEIISGAAGRRIEHVRLDPTDLARKFTEFGLDENYAKILAQLDGFLASGSEARTTDAVEQLTGTPAQSFSAFAAAHKNSWRL